MDTDMANRIATCNDSKCIRTLDARQIPWSDDYMGFGLKSRVAEL